MRTAARVASVLVAWSGFTLLAGGQGAIQLHSGGIWSNYTTVPSVIWTNPASDQEAADDFNVTGTITRVVANGHGCFQCAPTALAGVWVRFYAWQGGVPGTLQYQAFVPAGTPREIITHLNRDIAKHGTARRKGALDSAWLRSVGSTPEEFVRQIKIELEKWVKVIRAANIKAQ